MNEEQQKQDELVKLKRYTRFLRDKRKLQVATYVAVIVVGAILAREWYYPTALMLLYFFGWLGKIKDDYSRLELGDRMYFMGYTFTLICLGYVLYDPTRYAGTLEAFYYFGTAVFTSVVGLIIRSGLHLFYRAPEQQMDEINAKIGMVGDKIVKDLEQFSEGLNLRIKTLDNDIRQSQEKNQKVLKDNLEKFSHSASELFIRTLTDNVYVVTKWQESFSAMLSEQKTEIKSFLTTLSQSTNAASQYFLKDLSHILQDSIQSLNNYRSDLLKELSAQQEIMRSQLRQLANILIAETEHMKSEMQDALDQLRNNHGQFIETVSTISKMQKESTTKLQNSFEEVVQQTSTTVETISKNLQMVIQQFHLKTEETTRNSTQVYEAINNNLANTRKLTEELNSVVKNLLETLPKDEIYKSISVLLSKLQQTIQQVTTTVSSFGEMVRYMRNEIQEFKEVSDLVDEIRETIKRKLDGEFGRK